LLVSDALALLREKDAEIERLRADNEKIIEAGFESVDYAIDKIAEAKSDTVRKIQNRVQAFLTDEETDVIISEGDVFIPISAVRKIAKDVEEGK
jgi:hypothetical protein